MNLIHKGKNILFFDIETTGFPTKTKPVDIIEVGARFVPDLSYSNKVETMSQLYSPTGRISCETTLLTGITETMTKDKPHITEHLNALQDRIDRADIVVAHNAPFDIRCLELVGFDFTGKEVFDTATHSKRMFPELKSHTMSSVCEHLKIDNVAAHRAIHDVNAMIQIYFEITDMDKYPLEIKKLINKHKKLTYTKLKK